MHPGHAELLAEIRRAAPSAGRSPKGGFQLDSYIDSGHPHFRVPVPDRRRIVRAWLAGNAGLAAGEILEVVGSLFAGRSHEEKTMAALLLGYHPAARRSAGPDDVDRWLDELNGWAEIDTLCQNVFTAAEMLADWPAWSRLVGRLARAPEPKRRRAALVLLTGTVRGSADERPRDLAIATVDAVRGDRDPLVAKAVSWLLRSLVKHHSDAVTGYLRANEAGLPKIAVRETRAKLLTGAKRGTRSAR